MDHSLLLWRHGGGGGPGQGALALWLLAIGRWPSLPLWRRRHCLRVRATSSLLLRLLWLLHVGSACACTYLHPPLPAPAPQLVHMLAHLGAKHSQRKAKAGGRSPASASTANLLSHEDQRNSRRAAAAAAAAAPTSAPAVPSMPKLRRASGGAVAGAEAQAGGQDVENSGSAATTPRAAGAGAQPPSEAGGSEAGEGGPSGRSSVSTHLNELSAPAGLLTEPCDAMTSAVVAASCPDTVVGGDAGDKPCAEVRRGRGSLQCRGGVAG